MKKNTIKWKIFKYNITAIVMLTMLTTIVFNIAVRTYIKNDIKDELNKIAVNTENEALRHGPDFLTDSKKAPPVDLRKRDDNFLKFHFMLDESLKKSLSVLNADYVLLDKDKKIIKTIPEGKNYNRISNELINQLLYEVNRSKDLDKGKFSGFYFSGIQYVSVVRPVSDKNSFGLGWIVIYSSLQKINQIQLEINLILFVILLISAFITAIFSSITAKKVSESFSYLNKRLREISERNFGNKIDVEVYDELRDFVNNINNMSEKLETYDRAQKTFLQNASHEFRTPLTSIQSYAEGIKYDVIDPINAADIIIDESKRLTRLVEDLLYLSRLDSIEENYNMNELDFNAFIESCVKRINIIAIKYSVKISVKKLKNNIYVLADEEKLSRAVNNLISNSIRYAKTTVSISSEIVADRVILKISDNGSGFKEDELPYIFDRFYKGKNGKFGLGLSISKNVIEKLNGRIYAYNTEDGAEFTVELPISNKINFA
ncbi:sensor histidine kinase [Clostridium fermenticellae]|uniref:histidine kinase n=1 Tax=Clostridium fermenticellae TaxID=2068654 RepID=A0A386H6P0_9CLOT|nr:HAMP domain-containing sensor histidine kinase [Clostridium fermenticellae]AYD41427.1 sensor histidine kinase [Clostridium fermenticellae]